MLKLNKYIELLKSHSLFCAQQKIEYIDYLTGNPVMDSRYIKEGDIFFCIKGTQTDGHLFIQKARESKAALVIVENDFCDELPTIKVKDTRKAAALFAKMYFQNPSQKMTLIGITGTNGKTTTSMQMWQALRLLGFQAGWIGTLGYRIDEMIVPTDNTTPDIMELNHILAKMLAKGCSHVVMEVSSHGLALDRVYGLEYDLAIFTNLSQDHLDFHKDMDDYALSKFKLFVYTLENKGKCLINIDDDYGKLFYQRLKEQYPDGKVFCISRTEGDFIISETNYSLQGSSFCLTNNDKYQRYKTALIGDFNINNAAMTIAGLQLILSPNLLKKLPLISCQLQSVKGRLEKIDNKLGIGIYIDYAHTPDALRSMLKSISMLPHKRLLVVFGAGGDRDKSKRPYMLQAVMEYADAAIITDDNPRWEDPRIIIRNIVSNTDIWLPWWIIRNRKIAIESAIKLATEGDIVVIAGKGHETYQEIEGIKYHFDDGEVVYDAINNINNTHENERLILPVDPLMLEIIYGHNFMYDKSYKRYNTPIYFYVSSDSRTIKSGSLFFALKGDVYDGMDYLPEVLKDKENAAVIHHAEKQINNTIYYHDTKKAYGLLAKKYLMMFKADRIALTGSVGKTTTKEYLAHIFSYTGKVLKTEKNENNILGLSKTIFRIKPQDNTAIFEIGTNHFGEIATLADICQPHTAIITNIGPSHLQFFGDENGVYSEKTTLFRRKLKLRLFPDDERFQEFIGKGKRIGQKQDCEYRISEIYISPHQSGVSQKELQNSQVLDQSFPNIECYTLFKMNERVWKIPNNISFFVTNIAYAIATALEYGIKPETIQEALNRPLQIPDRMNIKQYTDKIVIWDCYNANPTSMKAAIMYWKEFQPTKPHIAILGDMLELGEKELEYHIEIGNLLAEIDYTTLICVGKLAQAYLNTRRTQKNSHNWKVYNDVDELLRSNIWLTFPKNCVILVKGSHSIHLERLESIFQSQNRYDKIEQQTQNGV